MEAEEDWDKELGFDSIPERKLTLPNSNMETGSDKVKFRVCVENQKKKAK